jgi:aspartate/methionine/tyrosine aminotransferase
MIIKKVVLDKADRFYHFPFDLEDFLPKQRLVKIDRRLSIIDLAHFNWPIKGNHNQYSGNSVEVAGRDDLLKLKKGLADWLRSEHNISVDPYREIYIGHGIRRIIFDLCLGFVEYGDIALVPEPGLPIYRRHIIAAGGVPVSYSMSDRTNYKPSFKKMAPNLSKTAKIMILNNPHNPVGTALDETDIGDLVRTASKENTFIVNDAAYCSLGEEKYISIFSIPGGNKVALEIFSIPLALGTTHLPFGFAIGAPEIIAGLESIGKSTGTYIPGFLIDMALKAVGNYPSGDLNAAKKKIGQSRLAAKEMAEKIGWKIIGGNSSPFVWLRIPGRRHSSAYASAILRRRKIIVLPGNAFGDSGEGFLRLSLTATPEDYRLAAERMSKGLIMSGGSE